MNPPRNPRRQPQSSPPEAAAPAPQASPVGGDWSEEAIVTEPVGVPAAESDYPASKAAAASSSDAPPGSPAASRLVDFFLSSERMRWLGAAVLVWGWLTVLSFNLALTREFTSEVGGRGASPTVALAFLPVQAAASGGGGGALRYVPAIAGVLFPLIALWPIWLTWTKLIRLTTLLGQLVPQLITYRSASPGQPSRAADWERDRVLEVAPLLISWFRSFAFAWLTLLVVGVGRSLVLSLVALLYHPAAAAL